MSLAWSVPPLLLYAAFRRYLQGMGVVRPVMVALVIANVVNVVVNWILIFGQLGAPAHGGSWIGVGDGLARVVMAAYLLVVIVRPRARAASGTVRDLVRIDPAWMRRLIALGFPAASQITLEVGVFAAATALAGRLAPRRSRRIRLRSTSRRFHVHGAARRRRRPARCASARRSGGATRGAARAGWTALLFGAGFMACAAPCSC